MTEQAALEFPDWKSAASALIQAWVREIRALAKEQLGPPTGEQSAVLDLTASDVVLRKKGAQGDDEVVQIARNGDLATELARAVQTLEISKDVAILLPAAEVLRPVLTLPSVKHAQLRGAIAYELERVSPIHPSQLYFDYQVLNRDLLTNMATIGVRAVRRSVVDGALAMAGSAGLGARAIYFEGDERPADWQTFPIDKSAQWRGFWRRFSLPLLSSLAIFLAVLWIFAAYARQGAALADLSDQSTGYSLRAAQVTRIEQKVDQIRQQIEFIGTERQKPLLVMILRDVTQLLPEDSWVNEFEKAGTRLTLHGYSRNAPALITIFGRSSRFAGAAFTAPSTQNPVLKADNFHLTANITGGWQ